MADSHTPAGAISFRTAGRQFVQFPDEMYIYEPDQHGRLARVLPENLPPRTSTNPDIERLRQELLASS